MIGSDDSLSNFTDSLDYLKSLIAQTNEKYGFTSENIEENQTVFESLEETVQSFIVSLFTNFYTMVIDLKDKVEH